MHAEMAHALVARFVAAVDAKDRALAKACCTPGGLLPGETPAALFLDALAGGYRLEAAGGPRVVADGRRAAMPVSVLKHGHRARALWLLAETGAGGSRDTLGLAGVTASGKVVDAFLADVIPANARLANLAPSQAAERFGAAVVQAHARHGRVSQVIGTTSVAALAAGMMLDAMLASPGAQIEVAETREVVWSEGAARAAVRFSLRRPTLETAEDFWVVLERVAGQTVVRATASALSLDLLLAGVEAYGKVIDKAAGEVTTVVPAPALIQLDLIDAVIAALQPQPHLPNAAGAIEAMPAPPSPRSMLEAALRERFAHDVAGAEALRGMFEAIARGDGARVTESLATVMRALIDRIGRRV